jgi:hypothetical protein
LLKNLQITLIGVLLTLTLSSISGVASCQTNSFNWTDTILSENKVKTIRGFDWFKSDRVTEGSQCNNLFLLDSLVFYLSNNSNQKVELIYHYSCICNKDFAYKITKMRVTAYRDYLITEGIKPDRILILPMGIENLLVQCKCADCKTEDYLTNERLEVRTVKVIN